MVLSAFAAADLHVQPSWVETAGLASLEAAVLDCAVVSTSEGYARAYLGEEAHYCDPAKPESIRCAVDRALRDGPSASLRRTIFTRFTLRESLSAMERIYEEAAA